MTYETLGIGIVSIKGKSKGPTIGIVCNVHGNELCGRKAVHRVLEKYEIERGKLILIDGNQEAALLNRRFVKNDMNRMFTKKQLNKKNAKNDLARAQYLAQVIPTLGIDYAVDFHSTSTETKYPFTVSFPGSEVITDLCPMPRIYGWPGIVEGSLVEFMNKAGIPAVVVEAGQHFASNSVRVAEKTLHSVLSHFDIIALDKPIKNKKQKRFEVIENISVGDAETYKFSKLYGCFDDLKPGERIAKDKTKIYLAPKEKGLQIMMPALQENITNGISPGAYYLIREI